MEGGGGPFYKNSIKQYSLKLLFLSGRAAFAALFYYILSPIPLSTTIRSALTKYTNFLLCKFLYDFTNQNQRSAFANAICKLWPDNC